MKKTLKRSLIILIMMLAGLILGTVKVSAASISAPTSVTEGQTITVTVNYGEKVKSAQMTFSYNSSNLEYKSSNGTYNPTTKKYAIFGDGTDSLSSATFTFIAKKAGSVSFSYENLKAQSTTNGKFEPQPSSGTAIVTVNAKSTPKPDTKPDQKPNNNTNTNNNTTTSKKPTFSGGTQKVYAKETVSIRDTWSTSGKLLGTLQKDSSITRTGIGSNGWDRVTYNGRTAYISHTYLTTTKPKDNKDDDKDKNNTTNEVSNNTTNNESTNNTSNNEINNQTNDITNSETNEATNTQTQGNTQKDDKKGFSVNTIEIIIISVIVLAIIVIIINEILAKKREEKRRSAKKRDEKRVKGSRR